MTADQRQACDRHRRNRKFVYQDTLPAHPAGLAAVRMLALAFSL